MTVEGERSRRRRKRLALVVAAIAILLALLFVPPYVSISRYKSRITQLVSASLGRPVRLSSVELRLLPRPGFVITDLTVEEDPAFGAEPILHANTVVASIRLFSLWRGRLELSLISVDEASLNLVRNGEGHWNLDPFFRAATAKNLPQGEARPPLPYLEATNSRINVKNGIEKLPYSLVNADLSFWQESPGEWRVRLRGQPARTDVTLDLADTGIVRLEGRLQRASDLSQMPLHFELDWREAQLGQLSRLILGSDPGWRGNLTGQMQLDGTAQATMVKTRLTATGVHRAEFAPSEPLDFDANCNFEYRYLDRSVQKLACDSPLGDGHIKLTGELPGDQPAKFSVEAQRVPVSAGLDMLRTLRSGFNSDLEAGGTVSGNITYDPSAAKADGTQDLTMRGKPSKKRIAKSVAVEAIGPLSGSLTLEGLRLSGGGLSQPIQIPKPVTLQPAPVADAQPQALAATIPVPAAGASPLAVAVQLSAIGYQATIRGQAALPRIREFARVAGVADISALDGLAGDPVTLDLGAQGSWLPAAAPSGIGDTNGPLAPRDTTSDRFEGTLTVHNANWKSDALVNHVEISQAVLHLSGQGAVWDPIEFSDGPVKGTARFQSAPPECSAGQDCAPQLSLNFDELDVAQLQAALLGAKQQSTVISDLIDRFSSTPGTAWPRIDGTIHAHSIRMGPVAIQNAVVSMRLLPDGAEFTDFTGDLLGGEVDGNGKVTKGNKPAYVVGAKLEKASPAAVCRLFSLRCTGGPINAEGRVELAGFTDKDLGASATGTLHFEWRRGAVAPNEADPIEIPEALARFDRWTADVKIGGNAAAISASQVVLGLHKAAVDATVTLADKPAISFAAPKPPQAAKR